MHSGSLAFLFVSPVNGSIYYELNIRLVFVLYAESYFVDSLELSTHRIAFDSKWISALAELE